MVEVTHFDKELELKNLVVDESNTLQKEQRRAANFARLIHAARRAESAWQDDVEKHKNDVLRLRDRIDELQAEVIEKDRKIANLSFELERYKLRERAEKADLTVAQRRIVLLEGQTTAG